MRTQWDIVIIGAGPAGMSAALQATRHGLSVLVLDRQAEPGGQIFRSAGSASADKRKEIGADYARGEALVREFRQSPATFLGGANVWHLAPGRAYVSHQGTSHVMQARQILIATFKDMDCFYYSSAYNGSYTPEVGDIFFTGTSTTSNKSSCFE